jgi:ATP-binding cassette subfamily B protein
MSLLRAAWFMMSLGARIDRTRLVRATVLTTIGYLSMPLMSLLLGAFTTGLLDRNGTEAALLAVAIGALLVSQLMLGHFAHIDYFAVSELQESTLRGELMELVHGPGTVAHLDDAAFADNLGLVREGLFAMNKTLESILQLGGLLLQLALTIGILATMSPWLAVLPLAAIPAVVAGRRAQDVVERGRERTAEQVRLRKHLMELATDSATVKELRIFDAGDELIARHDAAWQAITSAVCRAQARAALLRSAGQVFFAAAYGAAILLTIHDAGTGHAGVGALIVVITLASGVSGQVAGVLGLMTFMHSAGATVDRIIKMRAMSASARQRSIAATEQVPETFRTGITLEHLTFRYPGASGPVLDDVSLTIPAGHTLAVVGENGAGKSTLIKLLCGMYTPTSGRILIDGRDLAECDLAQWRSVIASLFQDFYKFEFTLREGIGLGEVERLDDDGAVMAAVTGARAEKIVDVVPGGLDGITGRRYDDGAELSGGQWQTVGLARCLMRDRPRLLILDEPAAALDAAAEHALFERYTSAARESADVTGGITVLVSHRFSTVLMADTIAVLSKGKLIEHGTHAELLARDGQYADLFQMQARVYS